MATVDTTPDAVPPVDPDTFRPTSFHPHEFVGNTDAVAALRRWLGLATRPDSAPNAIAIVSGPPGVGKSTAVGLLAAAMGLAVIRGPNAVPPKGTVAVIDHADTVDPAFMDPLLQAETSPRPGPTVCLCRSAYAPALWALHRAPGAIHVVFKAPTPLQMRPRLIAILHDMLALGVTTSVLDHIAVASGGDMRAAVHLAHEFATADTEAPPQAKPRPGRPAAGFTTMARACTTLLSNAPLADRMRAAATTGAADMVHHNLYAGEHDDLRALAEAAEWLSQADMATDRDDEIECIVEAGHAAAPRSRNVLVAPKLPQLAQHRRRQEAVGERVAAMAVYGERMWSRRTVAMELLPLLRDPDILHAVETNPGVAAWYASVAQTHGLGLFRAATDDVAERAGTKTVIRHRAMAAGFRPAYAGPRDPPVHLVLAEVARDAGFGQRVPRVHGKCSPIPAAAAKRTVFSADYPKNHMGLYDPYAVSDAKDNLAIKDHAKPAAPQAKHITVMPVTRGGAATPAAPVTIPAKRRINYAPKFKPRDARNTRKLTEFVRAAPSK